MALHDGSIVYADTEAEILDELIPGYEFATDDEKVDARIRHARQAAAIAQKLLTRRALADGAVDVDEPATAELLRICDLDKSLSLGLEDPAHPGHPAEWRPVFPLVLVTTSYAPHSGYPPIGGNVVWIDPTGEAGYLGSLRDAGVFDYWSASLSR